jgi:hypothetical protein
MTTALYLILSSVLIGAGIGIIWRDVRIKSRAASRGSFTAERNQRPFADPDVEITIARGPEPELPRRASPTETLAPLFVAGPRSPTEVLAKVAAPDGSSLAANAPPMPSPTAPASVGIGAGGANQPRLKARLALEQQWSALQPAIATGVARTNALLAPIGLAIGPAGEPAWSYKNRGYGAHRRLLMGGESVAWLRLELLAEGPLCAHVKAHREDRAHLNASADMPPGGLDGERAGALLLQCLEPAAAYATRDVQVSEEAASKRAWESVDGVVAAALSATNGALAQTGARLAELAPAAWERDLGHHRMALSVEVNGDDVARMHIERLPHELEVAVGVREPQLAALGRRRRIPVDGMTIHALAELIASCAWPAIARFKETRRQI